MPAKLTRTRHASSVASHARPLKSCARGARGAVVAAASASAAARLEGALARLGAISIGRVGDGLNKNRLGGAGKGGGTKCAAGNDQSVKCAREASAAEHKAVTRPASARRLSRPLRVDALHLFGVPDAL